MDDWQRTYFNELNFKRATQSYLQVSPLREALVSFGDTTKTIYREIALRRLSKLGEQVCCGSAGKIDEVDDAGLAENADCHNPNG